MKYPLYERIIEALGTEVIALEKILFNDINLNLIQLNYLTHKVETIRGVIDDLMPLNSGEDFKDYLNKLSAQKQNDCTDYYTVEANNVKRAIIGGETTAIEILRSIIYATN